MQSNIEALSEQKTTRESQLDRLNECLKSNEILKEKVTCIAQFASGESDCPYEDIQLFLSCFLKTKPKDIQPKIKIKKQTSSIKTKNKEIQTTIEKFQKQMEAPKTKEIQEKNKKKILVVQLSGIKNRPSKSAEILWAAEAIEFYDRIFKIGAVVEKKNKTGSEDRLQIKIKQQNCTQEETCSFLVITEILNLSPRPRINIRQITEMKAPIVDGVGIVWARLCDTKGANKDNEFDVFFDDDLNLNVFISIQKTKSLEESIRASS